MTDIDDAQPGDVFQATNGEKWMFTGGNPPWWLISPDSINGQGGYRTTWDEARAETLTKLVPEPKPWDVLREAAAVYRNHCDHLGSVREGVVTVELTATADQLEAAQATPDAATKREKLIPDPSVIRAALAEHQRVSGITRTAMCTCGWEVPLRGKADPSVQWSAHFECDQPWPCDTAKLCYPSEELRCLDGSQ